MKNRSYEPPWLIAINYYRRSGRGEHGDVWGNKCASTRKRQLIIVIVHTSDSLIFSLESICPSLLHCLLLLFRVVAGQGRFINTHICDCVCVNKENVRLYLLIAFSKLIMRERRERHSRARLVCSHSISAVHILRKFIIECSHSELFFLTTLLRDCSLQIWRYW